MRVALIGGCGFIGHKLAIRLRQAGHAVLAVDNLMWNNLVDNVMAEDGLRRALYQRFIDQRFEAMRFHDVQLANVDARQALELNDVLAAFGATDIVHLSAISSALEAKKRPGLCFDLQLLTFRNVLEYARRGVHRVMLMSSSTVYGDFDGAEVTEDTRPRPRGIYANAKYMAERLARTYADQYGIATTIVRPSALYGPRCISGRVSQKFVEMALAGKPLPLDGGGAGLLDFTHIDDLVEGLALALDQSGGGTNTFNLTYGRARTIREMAEVLRGVIPCEFVETPANTLAPVRGTLSTARAEKVLGFKATRSLEDGYRAYCEWYKEQWAHAETARRDRAHAA